MAVRSNESPAVAAVGAYMCLLTISSMFATVSILFIDRYVKLIQRLMVVEQAFRDPGILPRNLDPDPPVGSAGSEESLRQPLPRDLKVRAGSWVPFPRCYAC